LEGPFIAGKPVKIDIHNHMFDVAVSFPGEHRTYVEAVINALSDKIKNEKIFYNGWYTPLLAGLDLDTVLQKIYRYRSNLIVAFLCGEYQEKEWCGLEARSIRALIKDKDLRKKIMLVRLDDKEVDGFFDIDGWINAKTNSPKEVAEFIHQRLNGEIIFPVSIKNDTESQQDHTDSRKTQPNEVSPLSVNRIDKLAYFTERFPQLAKLKILLVKTSIKYPVKDDGDFGIPLGLWMLKGHLGTIGYKFDVSIYDERLLLKIAGNDETEKKKVFTKFENYVKDYDVIGVSLSTSEVFPAIEKFRIAKKLGKITLAGGIFAASNEEFLLKSGVIDYVISGVSTVPLSELLARLYRAKQEETLSELTKQRPLTIRGVATGNFNAFESTWCPSQLPTMRKGLWIEILKQYGKYIDKKVDIYTARGCIGNCMFCSVQRESRQEVYQKDCEEVINEINFLNEKGINYFSFKDENFFSLPNRKEILEKFKGKNIKFKIRARYDQMIDNKISLQELQSCGVVEIQYGLESPDWYIRKNVDKGDEDKSDRTALIDFIRSHSDYDIKANCSFILGIDGEDKQYYDNLLDFIQKIYDGKSQPKIYINFLTPHPYNSKFELPKYALVTKDLNYFTHKHPVCFVKGKKLTQKLQMLDVYDKIIKHTCSEKYNLTADKMVALRKIFLNEDQGLTDDLEYPKTDGAVI